MAVHQSKTHYGVKCVGNWVSLVIELLTTGLDVLDYQLIKCSNGKHYCGLMADQWLTNGWSTMSTAAH